MALQHQSVLLTESLEALAIKPGGRYLDGTFGRGGHSRGILQQLGEQGRLLAMDKDPSAIEEGKRLAEADARFSVCHGSFAQLSAQVADREWDGVDGVLLDLGVSSPQLDDGSRGFSFQHDGPLDMRMNPMQGESAADWLASARQSDIERVLRDYGEERFARRIAAAIVNARGQQGIQSSGQLAEIVKAAHPAWEKGRHPATKSFQAIRIHINGEIEALRQGLDAALSVLRQGGRLVVISFHSLEDRLVKRFMRDQARGEQLPHGLPIRDIERNAQLCLIGGAVRAGAEELACNPRARSAVMRAAERL